jgi:hypothetical protein
MAVVYNIPAIPTVYKGRRYRSRLEARWGAFFDLCGWEAEYEPYDLGSWSPDFMIRGQDGQMIVAEVKPVTEPDADTLAKMHQAAREANVVSELLLLGVAPFNYDGHWYLGWLQEFETGGDAHPEGDGYVWVDGPDRLPSRPCFSRAPFNWYGDDPNQIDFCDGVGSFHGRITGHYDGGHWGQWRARPLHTPPDLWAEAGNLVQWRPR